ncbi:MAG TPA: FAD-dependent oxidoreductase [Solirubrobacteraceae bacterium]|nr:FAD-dependent oxidoreductase [Solirubrobacteraceae bacterium]
MSISRLVIVGASLAGLRAAQAARKAGFDGELVMVGEERHLPYTRPPLSKELLAGEQDTERVHFPCDTLEAEWRLGVPAASLDRGRRRVVLADGDEVSYDRLIVATGSRPRRWPGAGGELDGVHVLRNLEDALALRAAFAGRPRVAIVGAGFIGCEVAQTARKAGLEVTLIEVAATPMLPLGPELGEWCAELHRENGVDLRLATGVTALLGGSDHVEGIELADGERVGADVVVIGLGAVPNTEWLASSGLRADPGLACDATLTAADDPDILGAGDIVAWPHPLADGDVVRIEHWTVAAEQGQLAGRNALAPADERKPYDTPPYFWSDQYDKKIQSIGFPGRADRLEQLESTPDRSRVVYAGERDGRVVGVIAINAARRLGAYRMALEDPPAFEELRAKIAADPAALGAPSAV